MYNRVANPTSYTKGNFPQWWWDIYQILSFSVQSRDFQLTKARDSKGLAFPGSIILILIIKPATVPCGGGSMSTHCIKKMLSSETQNPWTRPIRKTTQCINVLSVSTSKELGISLGGHVEGGTSKTTTKLYDQKKKWLQCANGSIATFTMPV